MAIVEIDGLAKTFRTRERAVGLAGCIDYIVYCWSPSKLVCVAMKAGVCWGCRDK